MVRSVIFAAAAVTGLNTIELPRNADDFGEPHWELIIEDAFPTWEMPPNGCPRLDKVGGKLMEGYEYPKVRWYEFNPCYYTKAFAGMNPQLGGYPTPIDTHYPYEYAAPFMKQPGDGSTHHCPMDAPKDTPIQSCPKVNKKCKDKKDCVEITDDYGIGHIPPFVPLAAVKDALDFTDVDYICANWFGDVHSCNIKKSVLDELVVNKFGTKDGRIEFQPPILIDGQPSSTYYRLEYINDGGACGENCRGPHHCSAEAAAADIWGDFCPYVHTGENSGQYRHPHIAFAALELKIANMCKPKECPKEWLHSPNGQDYPSMDAETSITWAAMEDENDPMSQPKVPYSWPNAGQGIFPGHELYNGKPMKPVAGQYVMALVSNVSEKRDVSGKCGEQGRKIVGGSVVVRQKGMSACECHTFCLFLEEVVGWALTKNNKCLCYANKERKEMNSMKGSSRVFIFGSN